MIDPLFWLMYLAPSLTGKVESMTTVKSADENSFEASLASLETIVSDMEKGELSLEDALGAFEKGINLVRNCEEQLKSAEQRVKILTQSGEGTDLQDFEVPEQQNPS